MSKSRRGEKMAQISVIVPVYNGEAYLKECLDSILAQTLKDIEVICVDDGSTDSSLEILKDYGLRDTRLRIISKENGGYGQAMNMGLDSARSEFVAIVEADDFIKENMLEHLLGVARRFDAQVVKSDYYEYFGKTGKKRYRATPTSGIYYNKCLSAREDTELFDFKMNTWTGIYRLDLLREHQIRHNETPGASFQDNGFWFQTLALSERTVFVNKAFYFYRQDNPLSSINSKEKLFCMCDEYDFIRELFEKNKGLWPKLIGAYHRAKFYNYLYTYSRVGKDLKAQFLERFSKEFTEAQKSGELKDINLSRGNAGLLEKIIGAPRTLTEKDLSDYGSGVLESIKRKGFRYTLGKIQIKLKEISGQEKI